jgi:hypothetical protein
MADRILTEPGLRRLYFRVFRRYHEIASHCLNATVEKRGDEERK